MKKLLEPFQMVDCNPKAMLLKVNRNLRLLDCPEEMNLSDFSLELNELFKRIDRNFGLILQI